MNSTFSTAPTARSERQRKMALVVLFLIALVLAALLLARLAQPGPAEGAEPDLTLLRNALKTSSVSRPADQSSPLVIPAAALVDDGNNVDYFYPFYEGYLYSDNSNATYCGQAPVYLPNGVQVNSFTAYAYDNYASGFVSATLRRKAFGSTTASDTMASTSTTVDNTSLQTPTDNTISFPIIDNENYVYFVGVCLGSNAAGSNNRIYALGIDFSHVAHVPLALNKVCTDRMDGRESEPNENRSQANWICLGIPVTGYPNNSYPNPEFDYFRVYWNGQGTLQVDLTNFVADAQLILYHENDEVIKDTEPDINNNFQVTYNGAAGPGNYHILATAGLARPNPGSDYTLTVTVK